MTDFLDEKRKEIDARLKELKPLVAEYDRLEKAAAALSGVNENGSTSGRSRGSSRRRSSGSGTGRRGRPKGTGKRAIQAAELVAAQPGITIAELAETMDIAPNYLYRVMPTLQEEGKVKKEGSGWAPA